MTAQPLIAPPAPPAAAPVVDRWRPAVLLAGPAAVVSVVLVIAAAAGSSGDAVAMVTSGLGIASSVAALAALVLMAIGLTGLAMRVTAVRKGFGLVAWVVAAAGTILTAGGYWSSVFVQPGLAKVAPDAVTNGLDSITAGFVASYAVMGLGWILIAVALLRARALRVSGWFLAIGGLLCVSPLPFRYLPLAIVVSVALGLRLRPTDA